MICPLCKHDLGEAARMLNANLHDVMYFHRNIHATQLLAEIHEHPYKILDDEYVRETQQQIASVCGLFAELPE